MRPDGSLSCLPEFVAEPTTEPEDNTPVVAVSGTSVTEGEVARFSLNNLTDVLQGGDVVISGGTADASDYFAWATSEVEVPANSSFDLILRIREDSEAEGTETVEITFTPTGPGGPGTGTVTIVDND